MKLFDNVVVYAMDDMTNLSSLYRIYEILGEETFVRVIINHINEKWWVDIPPSEEEEGFLPFLVIPHERTLYYIIDANSYLDSAARIYDSVPLMILHMEDAERYANFDNLQVYRLAETSRQLSKSNKLTNFFKEKLEVIPVVQSYGVPEYDEDWDRIKEYIEENLHQPPIASYSEDDDDE